MRVVFDTNVLISAFLWQQNLKPIYDAIRRRAVSPCFTQDTWAELQRALSYKKFGKQLLKINISSDDVMHLLASRSHFSVSRLRITEIKDDPSDNMFLACALASRASFIVSGDTHLLSLKKFQKIRITRPRDFIEEVL